MRAAFVGKPGNAQAELAPIALGNIEMPEPGPGEVRVRVEASGVNPFDLKLRGRLYAYIARFDPYIPHNDGAGTVDAVGEGVEKKRLGERVWLRGAAARGRGTAAEFVVLPATCAHKLPEPLTFAEGACLGVPLITAWHNVRIGGNLTGKLVLVTGGAGSVGSYAIQLAKLGGARVLATVSSPEKAAHATAAGADAVFDYTQDGVAEAIREATGGHGADFAIDANLAGTARLLPRVMAPYGRISCYGADGEEAAIPVDSFIDKQLTIIFAASHMMTDADRETALRHIGDLLAARKLTHKIGATFPLERIAEAHDAVATRSSIGKIVVEP